jgi:hypothetical protein
MKLNYLDSNAHYDSCFDTLSMNGFCDTRVNSCGASLWLALANAGEDACTTIDFIRNKAPQEREEVAHGASREVGRKPHNPKSPGRAIESQRSQFFLPSGAKRNATCDMGKIVISNKV